jgi:hypothetical protein
MTTTRCLLFCLTALLPIPASAAPRQENHLAAPVRVYLDCSGCDSEYVRTEIPFVDYVRDRTTSDVHLLITFQSTGAGGRAYMLNYIGRGRFEGVDDTLRWTSSGDATSDLIRRGLTRTIKLGLVRFAATTALGSRLDVTFDAAADTAAAAAAPARDPWNFWVFSLRTNGFFDGESSRTSLSMGGGVSASRTTAAWKFELGVDGNYREGRIEIDDSTTVEDFNRSYDAGLLLVKSIGPHVSAGVQAALESTTFGNQELVARLAPAFEYNIFPYTESTRRQLTFTYSVGANSFDYREITIFGRTAETLGAHTLNAAYSTRQPWGSSSLSLSGSQFLHDAAKYRFVVSGSANIRVLRGLSLNFGGNYSLIRDQLSLPARDATPDEILLRRRQVATNYRYFVNFGVSYNFGSIFSTVVNPRMRRLTSGSEVFF